MRILEADWERGIRILRATPNVAAEMAGFDPTSGAIEMAVRELGAERVVFGSDVGRRSFASQLAKTLGADTPTLQDNSYLAETCAGCWLRFCGQKDIRIHSDC